MVNEYGYIVLYHFDPPYKHAKHCFDFTTDVNARIRSHYNGKTRGPKLVHAALLNGSKLLVGRILRGELKDMLAMRMSGNATRICKLCRHRGRTQKQDDNLLELLTRSVEIAKATKEHKT